MNVMFSLEAASGSISAGPMVLHRAGHRLFSARLEPFHQFDVLPGSWEFCLQKNALRAEQKK